MSIAGPDVAVSFRDGLTSSNCRDLATEAARELQGKLSGINAILLYTPFEDVACDEILAGIKSVFGRDMPIAGGLAADNGKAKTLPFLFYGQTVTEHGMLMIGLADQGLELLSIAHHGNRSIGQPFLVTAAEGNRILELDGGPAWLRVVRRLSMPDETTPVEAIPLAALGIEIDGSACESYDNSHVMLVPLRTDSAGGFYLNAKVAVGTRLHLMQRDEEKIFAGVERMMRRMETMVDRREIVAVFHADCLARGPADVRSGVEGRNHRQATETFDRRSGRALARPLSLRRVLPAHWQELPAYLHDIAFPLVRRRAA